MYNPQVFFKCRYSVSILGVTLTNNVYATTPTEKMSAGGPCGLPQITSGAMHSLVPQIVWCVCSCSSCSSWLSVVVGLQCLAKPKSANLIVYCGGGAAGDASGDASGETGAKIRGALL